MGTDAHLYKVKEEIDPYKTIEDIKIAGERAGQIVLIDKHIYYDEDGDFRFTTTNSANTYEDVDGAEQILMYIYGTKNAYPNPDFDALIHKEGYLQTIVIDVFYESEKIMLDFVYEYLKINPDIYLYIEREWVYTLEDLEKIRALPFDRNWCYTKPAWK